MSSPTVIEEVNCSSTESPASRLSKVGEGCFLRRLLIVSVSKRYTTEAFLPVDPLPFPWLRKGLLPVDRVEDSLPRRLPLPADPFCRCPLEGFQAFQGLLR